MQIDAPTATVLAAIVAAGVAGLVTLLAQWLGRRDERRRQFRLLAIQSGLDTWRFIQEMKMDAAKTLKQHESMDAPDAFIIHMLRVMETASDIRISHSEAARRIEAFPAAGKKTDRQDRDAEPGAAANASGR